MRARNLERLTGDIQVEYGPGVTVWGKGDLDHQGSISDHNEDDTRGSRSEQTDADNVPEHRALDLPFLGPFSRADAHDLRRKLTDRPANQRRLRYVILEQTIWRKRNGWKPEVYGGKYHNHLHVSSDAADDENGAPWDIGDAPTEGDEDMGSKPYGMVKDTVTGKVFALFGNGQVRWIGAGEFGILTGLGVPMGTGSGDEIERLVEADSGMLMGGSE